MVGTQHGAACPRRWGHALKACSGRTRARDRGAPDGGVRDALWHHHGAHAAPLLADVRRKLSAGAGSASQVPEEEAAEGGGFGAGLFVAGKGALQTAHAAPRTPHLRDSCSKTRHLSSIGSTSQQLGPPEPPAAVSRASPLAPSAVSSASPGCSAPLLPPSPPPARASSASMAAAASPPHEARTSATRSPSSTPANASCRDSSSLAGAADAADASASASQRSLNPGMKGCLPPLRRRPPPPLLAPPLPLPGRLLALEGAASSSPLPSSSQRKACWSREGAPPRPVDMGCRGRKRRGKRRRRVAERQQAAVFLVQHPGCRSLRQP